MNPWTASEENTALAVMRRGGSVEEIGTALPHRTARAIGIKAKRLQGVLEFEAKARATEDEKRREELTPAEIIAEFKRRHDGGTVTNDTLRKMARDLGVTEDRMRETMLRHWGVLE